MPPPRIRHQAPNPGAYEDEWDSRARCGWAVCEYPGSTLHYMIECFSGVRAVRMTHPELPKRIECPECRKVLFCSERHRDWYERSHIPGQYGRSSAGINSRYL